jgi:D-alanine-D-alanine ligase
MDGKSTNSSRRIALLAGGDSAEREISLASGAQISAALIEACYEPVMIDPADTDFDTVEWSSFAACFIALHGGAGEDGRIQAQLEKLGVPYTGSDSAASRLAMNKSAAKEQFLRCGVPTLPFIVLGADEVLATSTSIIEKLISQLVSLGFPLLIKPVSQGSSLGVGIAHEVGDLYRCLAAAAELDSHVLVEPFIVGREFTVAMLGRDPLPIIEIVSPQRFFSYEAKYAHPTTEFRFEIGLPPPIESQLYDVAVSAAEAVGTSGLVRIDLMLDQHNRPWVLEVNTIPGLTIRSSAPRAAQAAGINLSALADWMVRDAIARFETKPSKPLHKKVGRLRFDTAANNLQGMHF